MLVYNIRHAGEAPCRRSRPGDRGFSLAQKFPGCPGLPSANARGLCFLCLMCTQDLPNWNYDGSSTGQAPGHDSEVYLVPRAIFRDPFRGGDNILVMCDTYEPPRMLPDGTMTPMKAIPTNTRAACAEVMEKAKEHEPWFGIEQVRRGRGVSVQHTRVGARKGACCRLWARSLQLHTSFRAFGGCGHMPEAQKTPSAHPWLGVSSSSQLATCAMPS